MSTKSDNELEGSLYAFATEDEAMAEQSARVVRKLLSSFNIQNELEYYENFVKILEPSCAFSSLSPNISAGE